MRKLCMLFIGLLTFFVGIAQDNIVKINGDVIKSKVINIGTTEVSFKKFDNLNGPTYNMLKEEIYMIKFQNGTKEIITEKKAVTPITPIETPKPASEIPTAEKEMEPTPAANKSPEVEVNPKKANRYLDKVRSIQAQDPSFGFFIGNGWLGGQGVLSPLFGVEFRLPRKNVFVRGISVGARASFTGLGTEVSQRQSYTEIYGFGMSVKYYAPLPIKMIQPYFVAVIGGALKNHYVGTQIVQYQTSTGWKHSVYDEFTLYSGFGLGCNFMFLHRFGAFVETGYFTTAFINTGLTIKIGSITK